MAEETLCVPFTTNPQTNLSCGGREPSEVESHFEHRLELTGQLFEVQHSSTYLVNIWYFIVARKTRAFVLKDGVLMLHCCMPAPQFDKKQQIMPKVESNPNPISNDYFKGFAWGQKLS